MSASQLESGGEGGRLGNDGVLELGVAESAVEVSVVALHEEEDVLRHGVDPV